jgi:hypothetical protein
MKAGNKFLKKAKKIPKIVVFCPIVWYNLKTLYAYSCFQWLIRESCAVQQKSYMGNLDPRIEKHLCHSQTRR